MELWVRSQDKTKLIKTDDLSLEKFDYQNYQIKVNDNYYVGCYRTEQRALEILDEIQSKIKNQYIVEFNTLVSSKDMELVDNVLNARYNGEFIMQPQAAELHPVNSGVIIYEMPEE